MQEANTKRAKMESVIEVVFILFFIALNTFDVLLPFSEKKRLIVLYA